MIAASIGAQSKIALTFPKTSKYRVWVATDFPPAPYSPREVDSNSLTLDVAPPIADERLFVWDLDSGNVASRLQREIKTGWVLKPSDFDHVGKIILRVEHKGEAVSAAAVSVNDGKTNSTMMIDPTSKGELEAFNIEPGNLSVEVTYRTTSGASEKQRQTYDLPLKRSQPEPVFVASIPYEVDTVSTTPEDTAVPKRPPRQNWLAYLIALAIAASAGYTIFRWLQAHPGQVKQGLDALGVQTPDPATTVTVDAADAVAQVPLQQQAQILLPTASAAPVSLPTATNGPRLVDASGDALDLTDGVIVIGRDQGADVILSGETTISRRHAQLDISGGVVRLSDLGSTNGTFVNGARLSTETTLRSGDEVRFGSAKFRFEG